MKLTFGGTTDRGRRRPSTRAVLAERADFLARLGRQSSVTARLPDLVPASEWVAEVLRRARHYPNIARVIPKHRPGNTQTLPG